MNSEWQIQCAHFGQYQHMHQNIDTRKLHKNHELTGVIHWSATNFAIEVCQVTTDIASLYSLDNTCIYTRILFFSHCSGQNDCVDYTRITKTCSWTDNLRSNSYFLVGQRGGGQCQNMHISDFKILCKDSKVISEGSFSYLKVTPCQLIHNH